MHSRYNAGMPDYPGFFTNEELQDLPSDALEAAEIVCSRWRLFVATYAENDQRAKKYDEFLRWGALGQLLIDGYTDVFNVIQPPEVGTDPLKNINAVIESLSAIDKLTTSGLIKKRGDQAFDAHYTELASAMGHRPAYVFQDDDYSRMQTLINELRSLLSNSEDIHPDHKRRLLKRLEQMQRELHKVVSDLDRAMGFIVEATATLGQAAENLEPVMQRLDEMTKIIQRVVTFPTSFVNLFNPPQLPSSDDAPALPAASAEKDAE